LQYLGAKIRRTLATYEPKHLNARDNTCWEVMHGLIAFGPRTEIYRDGPGGVTVNAMGWLCWGGRCQGQPLLVLEEDHPHALYGVGLEGHDGQYLAMLAQWRVRPESPMHIGGKDFTVADLIQEEKDTCQSGTELTFKLISLAHYLPSDAQWSSRNGEQWDIPKLLKAEIDAPIHGATCGGSHRLLGIANAVKERAKQGQPIDGEWSRAARYIADFQRYTLGSLQNPDGSFSTEWFNAPADRPGDLDRKLQTTGHMLEFIVWSLPSDHLRDPRVIRALDFLSNTLEANPDKAWSIGPLGHALHALLVYHERMFNQPSLAPLPLAASAAPSDKAAATSSRVSEEPSLLPDVGSSNLTMSKLQKAVQRPKPPHSDDSAAAAQPGAKPGYSFATDSGSKATNKLDAAKQPTAETKPAAKTPTAKEIADASDGCTDSIPALAARVSTLRLALRDVVSALNESAKAPPAAQPAIAPPAAAPTLNAPTFPSDAPFDRPGTSKVGP
jgi:hypothetical protein